MQLRQKDGALPGLAGLVLAAGASTRLGQPKQRVQWRGKTLLTRAVEQALAVCGGPVTVVLGAHAGELRIDLKPLCAAHVRLRLVRNPTWHDGIGSSLACGIRAQQPAAEPPSAVLILLCDQPAVRTAELHKLASRWRAAPGRPVAASYGGAPGVPAIFPRRDFAALERLSGDAGARQLLVAATDLQTVPLPAAALDVDTPADLDRLCGPPPR